MIYGSLPRVLPNLGVSSSALGIREIPGRPALEYFLNPSKRGYYGAREFAITALDGLPPNAVIIADYTAATPLLYMQRVEGLRPDVQIAELAGAGQTVFAIEAAQVRPVFLAMTGKYYDIEGLTAHFTIETANEVYRLTPR